MGDIFDDIQPDTEDTFDRIDSEETSVSRLKTMMTKVLNDFNAQDWKRDNEKISEEIKKIIKEEISKIKPTQNVIERTLEKQIIKNIPVDRAVPVIQPIKEIIKEKPIYKTVEIIKKDDRKLVEQKELVELKKQTESLFKKIEELKNELIKTKEILPLLSTGGSGVIGIPSPIGKRGMYLTNDGVSAYWSSLSSSPIVSPFSISSFSDGLDSVIEIGTGVWKSAGGISFTAAYENGPATSGFISKSGWADLIMTNSFQGPTSSAESIDFPSIGGSVTFSLSASGENGSDSETITHSFYNRLYYGVSTKTSGFTASDVTSLAGSLLANSLSTSFSVNPGSGQYIVFANPTRLGQATFTVNTFEGGFMPPETVSITNSSGYTEDYYVYRSAISNLAQTTVAVS